MSGFMLCIFWPCTAGSDSIYSRRSKNSARKVCPCCLLPVSPRPLPAITPQSLVFSRAYFIDAHKPSFNECRDLRRVTEGYHHGRGQEVALLLPERCRRCARQAPDVHTLPPAGVFQPFPPFPLSLPLSLPPSLPPVCISPNKIMPSSTIPHSSLN
jgi:hypothetical protein